MGRSRSNTGRKRDTRAIARDPLLVGLMSWKPTPLPDPRLRAVEDRRYWHPEGPHRPALTVSGSRSRLVVDQAPPRPRMRLRASQSLYSPGPPSRVAFEAADRVLTCHRRRTRREVLLALGLGGRGGYGRRHPRFSWRSKISC